jgi:hypothetical protein
MAGKEMAACVRRAHASGQHRCTPPRGQTNQLHPVVLPQVSHFMQVPLRTRVKLPHSPQASPS